MTEQELYNQMLPMAEAFEKYKNKQLSALSADEVAHMGIIFNGVRLVYPTSGLPRIFTSSCSSCVLTTLEKFISIFDRIKTLYQVEETPLVVTVAEVKEDGGSEEPIKVTKTKRVKKNGK